MLLSEISNDEIDASTQHIMLDHTTVNINEASSYLNLLQMVRLDLVLKQNKTGVNTEILDQPCYLLTVYLTQTCFLNFL